MEQGFWGTPVFSSAMGFFFLAHGFFFGRLPRALWCIQARAQDSRWGGPLCQFIPWRARNIFCTPPRFFWRLTWIDGAPEIWYHFIVITKHQSSWVKWDATLLEVKLHYGSPCRSVVGRSVCHNFKFPPRKVGLHTFVSLSEHTCYMCIF